MKEVTKRRPAKPLPDVPREKLEALARGLSDSPLREALERMSRRKK